MKALQKWGSGVKLPSNSTFLQNHLPKSAVKLSMPESKRNDKNSLRPPKNNIHSEDLLLLNISTNLPPQISVQTLNAWTPETNTKIIEAQQKTNSKVKLASHSTFLQNYLSKSAFTLSMPEPKENVENNWGPAKMISKVKLPWNTKFLQHLLPNSAFRLSVPEPPKENVGK